MKQCFRSKETRQAMTQYGAWFRNVTGSKLEDGVLREDIGAGCHTCAWTASCV